MSHVEKADDALSLGLVVDGPPGFVQGLLTDWRQHYRTTVFSYRDRHLPFLEARVNRRRFASALTRFLASNDVVVFEWAGRQFAAASHLPSATPIVVRLHSYELFEWAPRVRWEAVSRIVLVSEAMRRRFCDAYPQHSHKTTVVYNGVDTRHFARSGARSCRVIGTLCNLVPIKRVYELVLAVQRLTEAGVDLTCLIGGPDGEGTEGTRYVAALHHLVDRLQLHHRVRFVGPVADAASFLEGLDVFISNSYWEGQQVALLEAMASGCYCLSHCWDGAEEVLPAEHLFVGEDEMCHKITEYFDLGAAEQARRRAALVVRAQECFSLDRTRASFRWILNDAVSSR
jgi:glycosyltransferase involved in cell wall biosynthesis